jgi:glucose/arabinose dehydrogenase
MRFGPIRMAAAGASAWMLVLGAASAPGALAATFPAGFQDTLVASLDRPTGLAFTPDGRLLIATEAGQVRIVRDGALLPAAPLDISSKVCSDGERGVMAVAVDPSYATNHFIYVYYTWKKFGNCPTAPSSQLPVNRVSRFVLGDNDIADPATETVLIDNIPAPQTYHIGADLHFGKDGYLYVSTGDGGCDYANSDFCDQWNDASRDQHVLLGKVLRVTRSGAIPPSNPYQGADSARCNATGITDPGKKCQETFAWGLRNPFRMAFDPNNMGTRFFINDVGEITWEEIDLGQPGVDYGWNVREGFCATGSTTDCGAPPAGMTNPIHAYYHYDEDCMSITGGAFVPNGVWAPQYDGSYLFGDLTCGKMFKLDPAPGGGYTRSAFASGFGAYSLITMTFGPPESNLYLYYVTWNGPGYQVRRITQPNQERYPRPGSGSPLRVPLVPAYARCVTPNATHAAPLALQSCSPPAQESALLTTSTTGVGTGFARLRVIAGDPATSADEADVGIVAAATDVRRRSDGADYVGKVLLEATIRITDRANGFAGTESATTVDKRLSFPVDCVTTPVTTKGGACNLATTTDTVVPGFAREGKRSVISALTIQLLDVGADGSIGPPAGCPPSCGSGDEAVFLRQGIFAP